MPRRRRSAKWVYVKRETDPVQCVRNLEGTNLMDGLRSIQTLLEFITLHEERLIRLARDYGWSWHGIAFEMGVSYQSVHRKWRRKIHGTTYDPNSSRRKDKWIERYGG